MTDIENMTSNKKELKDSEGTGVISTMIFMAISVIIMIALKYFIS